MDPGFLEVREAASLAELWEHDRIDLDRLTDREWLALRQYLRVVYNARAAEEARNGR